MPRAVKNMVQRGALYVGGKFGRSRTVLKRRCWLSTPTPDELGHKGILSALEFCESALPPIMTAPPGRLTINPVPVPVRDRCRQAEGSKGDKSP